MRGEGYTRDISPTGVYILTSDRLPAGAVVRLEVTLPSLRGQGSGALLQTSGHVVRSEEIGFAAVANMGFRMQVPETAVMQRPMGKTNGSRKHEAESLEAKIKSLYLASRSYLA